MVDDPPSNSWVCGVEEIARYLGRRPAKVRAQLASSAIPHKLFDGAVCVRRSVLAGILDRERLRAARRAKR